MSSTPTSDASTKIGSDSYMSTEDEKSLSRRTFERAQRATTAQDVLLFLVAFRILNALSIKTFFQPDEYFQSLEPAWEIAFRQGSGAWITWEWKHHLRSAIHPTLFAAVYWLASSLSQFLRLSPDWHADLMIAAPKATQAAFAALGDFYTWKLAEKIYGNQSNEAWATLILTVCSPWQWFCSTRTLSNCLETTLTTIALNSWPWHWTIDKDGEDGEEDAYGLRKDQDDESQDYELAKICRCLLLAALACILRPTNVLIWICLAVFQLWRTTSFGWLVPFRRPDAPIWIHISGFTRGPATNKERVVLVVEAALCGLLVLLGSSMIDRFYYQQWTLPPVRFLYFNVAQSLSVFYGSNPWHYYITQGYPLLLTTFLPFGIVGLYQSIRSSASPDSCLSILSRKILHQLATTAVVVPSILSLISHKEVRFIYPLLPILHIFSASPFTAFFIPTVTSSHPSVTPRRLILIFLALSSLALALFATTLHQTAPLSVLSYLRSEYTKNYLTQPPSTSGLKPAETTMTVGFLMPCHSTPWRSHLVFPEIKAWALGCEPPVNLNVTARAAYIDEADRFYMDPVGFLEREIGKPPQPQQRRGFFGFGKLSELHLNEVSEFLDVTQNDGAPWNGQPGRKMWTEYIAFFQQLEPTMKKVLKGTAYKECWRGWNSFGHDDWRRKGYIVVWCIRGRDKMEDKGPRRVKDKKEKLKVGWW